MAELNVNELKAKLVEAKSVLVLLPPDPDKELVSAASALHGALEFSGRNSIIGCSSVVADKPEIKTTVGKQNLIISFPYKEDAVEHVSYDIDEATSKFNLIIRPKENKQPLDIDLVEYNYTGASADLVFAFGIASLEELGKLYADEKAFLDKATIVAIKKGGRPADFATFDLSSMRVTSLAELISWLLRATLLKLPAEVAAQLYNQIITATNGFQSPMITPETFEVAAYLLRNGARSVASAPANLPPAPFFPNPPVLRPNVDSLSNEMPPRPKSNLNTDLQKRGVPADWQGPKIFRAGESA